LWEEKKVRKFTHTFTILDPSCCFSGTIYRKREELGKTVHFTLEYATKAQKGSRGVAFLFL
jgi:hypothetical protein